MDHIEGKPLIHIEGVNTRWTRFVEWCKDENLNPDMTFQTILKELGTSGGMTSVGDILIKGIRTTEELLQCIYPVDYKEPDSL